MVSLKSMKNSFPLITFTLLIILTAGLQVNARAAPGDLYLPLILHDGPVSTEIPTSTPTITPTPTETPDPFVYIEITDIEFNPPGNDVEGEFVVIENQGTANENMTGWRLRNEEGETFRFPTFILKAGAGVIVWTKEGTNTETDLHWGSESPIWSNSGGDCAELLDENRQLVDWYCY